MKEQNESVLSTKSVSWINQDIKVLLAELEVLIADKEETTDVEDEKKNTEAFLNLLDRMNALQADIEKAAP